MVSGNIKCKSHTPILPMAFCLLTAAFFKLFQNQRAKVKKIQKKRKQDGKHDNGNDSQNESLAGNGSNNKINNESELN